MLFSFINVNHLLDDDIIGVDKEKCMNDSTISREDSNIVLIRRKKMKNEMTT